MPRHGNGLTSKQAAFVAAYIADPNATQAALKAGYSPRSAQIIGFENLRKPMILGAIEAVNATAAQIVARETAIAVTSAAYVIRKAVAIVEYGTEMVPLTGAFGPLLDAEGEPVGYRMADARAASANLALLAKRHPEFRDGPLVDNSQHVHVSATIEELRAALREARDGGEVG